MKEADGSDLGFGRRSGARAAQGGANRAQEDLEHGAGDALEVRTQAASCAWTARRRSEKSVEAVVAEPSRSGVGHERLMELVVERENYRKALKRVRQNKGSPGVDGRMVEDLPAYLAEHWAEIREQLLGIL